MASVMDGDEYTFAEDRVLYKMVMEPEYRASLIGHAASADWDVIARYLKKTPESVQKRFLDLKDRAEAEDRTESDVSIDIGVPEGQPGVGAGPAPTPAGCHTAGAASNAEQPQGTHPHRPLQACLRPEPASWGVGAMVQGAGVAGAPDLSGAEKEVVYTARSSRAAPKIRSGSTKSNQQVASGAKTGKYWTDAETIHLLQLGRDKQYRETFTGSRALDWAAIGLSLGRGARAAKRKFDNLQHVDIAPRPDGNGFMLVLPANERKKWSDEEVIELLQLGDPTNAAYRREKLGTEDIDWKTIARYFRRSRDAVAHKFQYETEKGQPGKNGAHPGPDGAESAGDGSAGGGAVDELNGGSNSRKRHPLAASYESMTISALCNVQPQSLEATSKQICAYIESNPEYAPYLDRSILPGKKSVPRWKHGVRSALYAYSYFINTDRKDGGDIIWRLDVQVAEATKRQKQERRRVASINKAAREERRRNNLAKNVATTCRKIAAINEAVKNKKMRIAVASQRAARRLEGDGESDEGAIGARDVVRDVVRDFSNVSDGNKGHHGGLGNHAQDTTASGVPLLGRRDVHSQRHGSSAIPDQTAAPITLQQILEQSMTADQLAQLSPDQLADLQNQLNAGLQQPFQPYMGYYGGGMLPQDYGADLQPLGMAQIDMYPLNAQYQPFEGPPPGDIGRGPPRADRDSE